MEDNRDRLTHLYNRESGISYIQEVVRKKKCLTIAIMDIDFFSNINQKIGFRYGNIVLQKMACLMDKEKDLIAIRYGGDEFLLVICGCEEDEAANIIQNLKKKIKSQKLIDVEPYQKVPIKVSIGVAYFNPDEDNCNLLIKKAEIALSEAKKKGRNRIEFMKQQVFHIMKGPGICTTLIGNGISGDCLDGEEAFTAGIKEPYGVDVDPELGILFVDRSNHRIKTIKNDKVYVIAGKGTNGYSGDQDLAVNAELSKPSGVTVYKPKVLYIADTGNHCIRKIEHGIITTYAGCGVSGYYGDNGQAEKALLNRPGGVVVDHDGNVYTNDYGNNVVRKIDTNGIITTIAGNGEYGYAGDSGPAVDAILNKCYGLCVDSVGKLLYLADYDNHCIRCVDLHSGIINTICGNGRRGYSGDGGLAVNAELEGPFWMCLNQNRDLFIVDADANCIRKINNKDKIISTVAGNKEAGYIDSEKAVSDIRFNIPAGIVSDGNILYIADYANNAIRKVVLDKI